MSNIEKNSKKIFYTMGEVAEMFDVNTSLIRFWEQKFDVLKPQKNKKGNRLFSPEDVENLKIIYHLVKEKGMTLAGAQKRMKQNPDGESHSLEVIERLQNIRTLLLEVRQELGGDRVSDSDLVVKVQNPSMGDSSIGDLPMGNLSAENHAVEELSVGELPAENHAVEELSAEDLAVEELSVGDPMTVGLSVEDFTQSDIAVIDLVTSELSAKESHAESVVESPGEMVDESPVESAKGGIAESVVESVAESHAKSPSESVTEKPRIIEQTLF